MKNRKSKLLISVLLVLTASCNEPETVVTNIVHPDGSVTRMIEIKNLENKFEISDIQVPFDTTWIVRDSMEITEKGDTVWVKRAEKFFADVDAINSDYKADSGANKDVTRHAEFRKRFKWFNTEFSFTEVIEKKLSDGYPVGQFLNTEELQWFYSPDNLRDEKVNGSDSIKYRALNDTVDRRTEKWIVKSLASEWIGAFSILTRERADEKLTRESLKQREDEFVKIIERDLDNFDSLWSNGNFLREFIGEENALKYKNEADSAIHIAEDNVFVDFSPYTVRTIMPGKLTGTNGFIDSAGVLLWPVKSDFFLTEQYKMFAESKIPNRWAWILSGLFLIFVVTGIIIKKRG